MTICRGVWLLSLGVALALAGCGRISEPTQTTASEPSPATTSTAAADPAGTVPVEVEQPWAHEALLFFDSAYGALYAPSAVLENPMHDFVLEGGEAIAQFPGSLTTDEGTVHWVFLGTNRVAVVAEFPASDLPVVDMGFFEMSLAGIERETRQLAIAQLGKWGHVTAERAERLATLYEAYVTAWDSGAPQQIQALYQPGAMRRDGLFGGSTVIGEDWAENLPRHLTIGADGIGYAAVFAVHDPRFQEVSAAVYTVPTNEEPTVARALFGLTNANGCRLELVADWELDEGRISSERILYEVASLRQCAGSFEIDTLPSGWWTGWEPPAATDELTAVVNTPAGSMIPVMNAGSRQADLVEWGLQRFTAAALPWPEIDVIAFPPTKWCSLGTGDFAGMAVIGDNTARVEVCIREREICIGPTCPVMRTEAKLGLLHELGHVWEAQHVDDAARADFMELWDVDLWADPDPPWMATERKEGVEIAADVIAWGLFDEDLSLVRLGNVTPERLVEGFRLLTGFDPVAR